FVFVHEKNGEIFRIQSDGNRLKTKKAINFLNGEVKVVRVRLRCQGCREEIYHRSFFHVRCLKRNLTFLHVSSLMMLVLPPFLFLLLLKDFCRSNLYVLY